MCEQTEKRLGLDLMYIEKDFHVTEAIRRATCQSQQLPNTKTVFGGASCLSKTGLVHRHFESIDLTIVDADHSSYTSKEYSNLLADPVRNVTASDEDLAVFVEAYSDPKDACAILEYQYLCPEQASDYEDKDLGRVKAKWEIKHHAPEQIDSVSLCSYIGETAAINYPLSLSA